MISELEREKHIRLLVKQVFQYFLLNANKLELLQPQEPTCFERAETLYEAP